MISKRKDLQCFCKYLRNEESHMEWRKMRRKDYTSATLDRCRGSIQGRANHKIKVEDYDQLAQNLLSVIQKMTV